VRLIERVAQFTEALETERALGRRVGLVPTMGALHRGHRSLIETAARECEVVAVTVFVNPIQFDSPADLELYPRDLEGDLAKAGASGASIVFAPSVWEMYPGYPTPPSTSVHVTGVSEGLEGASRPGHFDGVATVVAKLLSMAGRCRAYFGEKDFQQLAVVRRLVFDLCLPVEVAACPTVREDDGLAMSSRNTRLSDAQRRAATALHRSLEAGIGVLRATEPDLEVARTAMREAMDGEPLVDRDYAEIVDASTMEPALVAEGDLRLLVAARVGSVRLIDNEGISLGDTDTLRPHGLRTDRELVKASTGHARTRHASSAQTGTGNETTGNASTGKER
jgi:pantoate--beta-alanine ligase